MMTDETTQSVTDMMTNEGAPAPTPTPSMEGMIPGAELTWDKATPEDFQGGATFAATGAVEGGLPGGLKMLNFISDVATSEKGPAKKLLSDLDELLAYSVSLGFPEEQAMRAISLWLITLMWGQLTMHTSVVGSAMLAVVGTPQNDNDLKAPQNT